MKLPQHGRLSGTAAYGGDSDYTRATPCRFVVQCSPAPSTNGLRYSAPERQGTARGGWASCSMLCYSRPTHCGNFRPRLSAQNSASVLQTAVRVAYYSLNSFRLPVSLMFATPRFAIPHRLAVDDRSLSAVSLCLTSSPRRAQFDLQPPLPVLDPIGPDSSLHSISDWNGFLPVRLLRCEPHCAGVSFQPAAALSRGNLTDIGSDSGLGDLLIPR